MVINLKVKGLITAALLISFSCFAEDSNSRAPEATAAEFEAQVAATTLTEATLAFSNLPSLEKAFIDAAPTDKKDGLVVGKLGIDGGNKELIVKLAQEIAEGHHGNFDSLLIAQEGKLMFESYYSRGRINLPHFQKSVTKVYISLAVGRAIQLGYLTMADLDQPLINFLKNIDPSILVAGAEKITLHQAMTMRSGIRLSQEKRKEINIKSSHLKGQRQVQAYLENSAAITAESQRFLYQNDSMLVMQVLDAVVSGFARDFIKKELIDKMEISNYSWETDVSGLPKSGSGSYMTSRDMVKWGLGYFWWQADMEYRNKSYFSTSARGGGGQYIILLDELDLVIVVTAHDYDYRTLQIVAERILPAFVQDKFPVL